MGKERILKIISMSITLFLIGFLWPLQAIGEETIPYISSKNAPVFYGTSEITVPIGTEIDIEHDARFRLFARDNEDEDLTQDIQITKNTIDYEEDSKKAKKGEYEIDYQVTDSDNNTTTMQVLVHVTDTQEIKLEKTMYTLPSVEHLNTLGYTRGNNHDRQIMGVFLDVDGAVEMRKTSGSSNVSLTVTLHNNDDRFENTIKVENVYDKNGDEGWTTIQNPLKMESLSTYNEKENKSLSEEEFKKRFVSTPTVKTLFQNNEKEKVVYEIKWSASDAKVKPLHYYHQNDGEAYQTQFFKEWREDTDSYAIIDGWSAMALVPYLDNHRLIASDVENNASNHHLFNTLDEWCAFWDTLTKEYDELIGLSYTPNEEWNQNVKTKFYIRANDNGPGSAYYAYLDCIGRNDMSVYSLFGIWWGNLHEAGHGYQGNVGASGYGLPITEVAVNIFSYYIQTHHWDDIYKFGSKDEWLSKAKKEEEYNTSRKEHLGYQDNGNGNIGAAAMLYSLVNILDYFNDGEKDGYKEAYAAINQYYRQVYFETNKKINTQDAWVLALEEKYHVNLVPYFESWGVKISQDVKDTVMQSDAKVIYYMADMIQDDEKEQKIKTELNNIGTYDLASTEELASMQLTGNVTLNFHIDDFDAIKGKTVYIYDGDKMVKQLEITSPTITSTLPVGTYKVALPKTQEALNFEHFYLTVVYNQNTEKEIYYTKIDDFGEGFHTTIQTRGYHGENYLPFVITLDGRNINIAYRGTWIKNNGVSADQVFSTISIYNTLGEQVYTKSVNGGGQSTWINVGNATETTKVDLGYKLKIMYKGDKNDFSFINGLTNKKENWSSYFDDKNEIVFDVTKYGLVPEQLASHEEELETVYKTSLDQYILNFLEEHQNDDLLNLFANPSNYNHISSLIHKLSVQNQDEYQNILKELSTGDFPIVSLPKNEYTFVENEMNLEEFKKEITIRDTEDGLISINSNKVQLNSNVDWNHAGTYSINIIVTDQHQNVVTKTVKITITKKEILPTPTENKEERNTTETNKNTSLSVSTNQVVTKNSTAAKEEINETEKQENTQKQEETNEQKENQTLLEENQNTTNQKKKNLGIIIVALAILGIILFISIKHKKAGKEVL